MRMEQPTGKLSMTFRKKVGGETYLAKQYFQLPLQIMKPHYQDDDGTAFVYLLNPGGGVLQHDRLLTEIEMEEGSRALVTTPSSTKFYKMDEGHAEVCNRIILKANSVLEYLPEYNVPFARSRAYQTTEFHLDSSSTLIASDLVTAGRVSRGEVFDYDLYSSRTKVYVNGKLEVFDHSHMEPGRLDVTKMGLLEDCLSNGTVYAYSRGMGTALAKRLMSLERAKGICFAAGNVTEDILIVRFMGNNMIELQKTVLQIWGEIREHLLGKPAVRIRKF